MNTEISYLYRDADNYKSSNTVVVKGEVRFSDIKLYLNEGTYFIPSQVDLDGLNGRNIDSDHPSHELAEDDLELTEAKPTISLTAKQLIKKFKQAHEQGWNEAQFFEDIASQAAAAANGFFLQEPKELSHLTDFVVRLQSAKFGLENFKHFNLEHALDKIIGLYHEAFKLNDSIERTIGLVIYPAGQGTVITVYRSTSSQKSLKVLPEDLEWALSELGMGEPQPIGNKVNERVFSDNINFDLLRSFLKQKELLVYGTDESKVDSKLKKERHNGK